MGVLAPPHLKVDHGASALGVDFGGYGYFVRETRAVPGAWQWEAFHAVQPGRKPATVEANETRHIFYRLGWHNSGVSDAGRHSDGWDIAVGAYNTRTRRWTSVEPADLTAQVVTGDAHPWLVCEEWPFLSCALDRTETVSESDRSRRTDFEVHGRGLTTAVTRLELPARDYEIGRRSYTPTGEDALRYLRALAASGRQVCLHLPLGDRVLGVIDAPSKVEHSEKFYLDTTFTMVETGRPSAGIPQVWAPSNVPCGTVLDGTADYWTIVDTNDLDPASSAFTIAVLFAPTTAAGSDAMVAKGNVPTADGYLIGTTAVANEVQFVVKGASATATLTSASASYFDSGDYIDARGHAFIGGSTGTAQWFDVDGTQVGSDAVTHGAVSNAIALTVGALNAGASAHCAGKAIAVAYWARSLSATERTAAAYWLRGYPGYRMPYGPKVYIDTRYGPDLGGVGGCWNGLGTLLKDLSGNRNHATVVGAPPTQGNVWPLSIVERFG